MAQWEALIRRARAFVDGERPAVARHVSPPPNKNAVAPARGRLIFGVDATGSRQDGWNAARQLTDAFFSAVPAGELEIALAFHAGGRVRRFTPFTTDARTIRRIAARITCEAGETQFHGILRCVLNAGRVGVVVYISDSSEEDDTEACRLADALNRNGTRVILHDRTPSFGVKIGTHIFQEIAERTGGAVLPFEISSLAQLRQLLAATAWLAVGGPELLTTKTQTEPGARLLLQQLAEPPRTAVARQYRPHQPTG